MTDLSVTDVTATSAVLNAIDYPGGTTALQAQVSPRADFAWCVCPIFTLPAQAANTILGLNQVGTYYARIRSVAGAVTGEWSNVIGFRTPLAVAPDTDPAAVMIDPAIIMVPEPILELLPLNEQAGYPADNLLRDAPVAWVSVGAAQGGGVYRHRLSIRLASQPIDTIALLNHNLPEDAQIDIQAGATKDAADTVGTAAFKLLDQPARASANLSQRYGYHALVSLEAAQSYPWWTIIIDAKTPGGLLYAEQLVIGLARRSKNHAVEKKETPIDMGSIDRSRSGQPTRLSGFKMRRVDFDLAMLTESQYETLYGDLGRLVGSTDPVLVVPNAKRGAFFHDRILYGVLTGSVVNPSSPRYTRSFTIDSIIA